MYVFCSNSLYNRKSCTAFFVKKVVKWCNTEMYDLIMSIYHFPSIIFTTYATLISSSDIIDFAIKHDNIHVITAPALDGRFDETAINTIHDNGMLLFTHSLNVYTDITNEKARGVYGIYTDLLLPKDMEIYERIDN